MAARVLLNNSTSQQRPEDGMMPTYKEGTDANNGRYAIAIGERQRTTPDKREEGQGNQTR